jgi:hypothetical protein
MKAHQALVGVVLVLLLTWTWPPATEAQLYRYKDANGNWCYTDNFADVPSEQREDCKQYESIQTPAAEPVHADRAQTAEGETAVAEPGRLRDELQSRKADLDHEYDALVKESGELEKQSLDLKSDEDRKAFEDRKNTFTQRLKVFEERRQVFEKDLRAYNDIVRHPKN